MDRSEETGSSPPARRPLQQDEVYSRLCAAIVDGTLAPGQRLRETSLALRLRVRLTSVRVALLRLHEAGLVVSEPGGRVAVASLDLTEAREAWGIATAMHRLAVRTAVPQLTSHDLERMHRMDEDFGLAIRRGDLRAALAADHAFHAVPLASAANHTAQRVLEHFAPHVRRIQHLRLPAQEPAGLVAGAFHRQLLHCCTTRDVDGAATAAFEPWPLG
jgi:DNA-binding GntR family transcriptional regulator